MIMGKITLKQVTKDFGTVKVIKPTDLEIEDGEFVVFVGPSGCGKSTLLRLLGGLERPGQGRVMLSGQAPRGCLNPLTYIFQDFALLPWRTAEGNISLVLEDHRLSAI